MLSKRARGVLTWLFVPAMVACAPAVVQSTAAPVSVETAVAGTLTVLAPSQAPTAPPASPTATPQPPTLWSCYTCGGETLWQLAPGLPHAIKLPVSIGQYYGYTAQTGRILMAQAFADHGVGPGNVAVSDLSILDLQSGQVSQILSDNVVEAAWGPDGQSFAYVMAAPSTYELRWRSADGQDSLLAKDVSFTWSVAPSGGAIAFTRESGYNLSAAPGLFVVTVPNTDETRLSEADKGGVGSISDRPVWSPDSQEVIFSLWGGSETRVILARADGSLVYDLGVDSSAADAWWSGLQISDLLWYPDGDHVLVNSSATNPDTGAGGMGGPTALVAYRLDRANHRLADGRLVGDTMGLIDWDVPGESIWSIGPGGQPESVPVSGAG
jgi:hypothetical protein